MPTALVTGGTSGIGAAFARQYARRGYDLVLVARDADRLARTADELGRAHGVRVEQVVADLGVRADLERVEARVGSVGRPIDVLVNNAGFGLHTTLLDPDWSEHERALDVMCLAVVVLGGAAGRAMRDRGHGRIINVASLAAWISQGGYSPVKAYVRAWSDGLANELHGTGVTVTALNPGWVRTEFHDRAGIRTSAVPERVWVDADRCAAEAIADAEAGRVWSIPTKRWKLAAAALDLAPRAGVRWLSRRLARSRA